MGTGYDIINAVLGGEIDWKFLLVLLACKLVPTAIVLGLGLPGGVIGPSLVLGGIAGAILGYFGNTIFSSHAASPSFYVLLGMCAMMGAVLQAPLAALMALLELSNNPELILPAMLIIVVANLTASEIFGLQSIFRINLAQQGILTPKTLGRILNRFSVNAVLSKDFFTVDATTIRAGKVVLPEIEAQWVIIRDQENFRLLETSRFKSLFETVNADEAISMAIEEWPCNGQNITACNAE